MKLAIIIEDNIYNRKGMMNAELNRIRHLMDITTHQIDVYTFQIYSGPLLRMMRHSNKIKRDSSVVIDEIPINVRWRRFSIIDYFLSVKLHRGSFVNKNWMFKYAKDFARYDMLIANSRKSGSLALHVKRVFNKPYCVTWHGTDIHTMPFNNNSAFIVTKEVMEQAEMNFMVSKHLLETSYRISKEAKRMVLYNGVDQRFSRYNESVKRELRKQFRVENKKVVAFAGHLIDVKNPKLFPEIFKATKDKFKGDIEFWIMGTGKLEKYVVSKCKEYNITPIMWGNIEYEKMPKILNCVDVLILPSKNEGLPLIAIEALACGANVVGSRVGGIPEAIGIANTFDINNDFIDNISNRMVCMLKGHQSQPLNDCFHWEITAEIENAFYNSYFNSKVTRDTV